MDCRCDRCDPVFGCSGHNDHNADHNRNKPLGEQYFLTATIVTLIVTPHSTTRSQDHKDSSFFLCAARPLFECDCCDRCDHQTREMKL